MTCQWNRTNCKFLGTAKCSCCFTDGQYYTEQAERKHRGLARHQEREDKRKGSGFEYANSRNNRAVLKEDVTASLTLNSGATVLEKGDAQIHGLVEIMEEYKTRITRKAPGRETFTIRKEWLEKLHREAMAEHMEFWDLKFSFHEDDVCVYSVIEQEILLSLVRTIVADRRSAKTERKKREVIEKELATAKAENAAYLSKIAELEAKLDLQEYIGKGEF